MVASKQHLYQTIVLPRNPATGSLHDNVFCYYPLVDIYTQGVPLPPGATIYYLLSNPGSTINKWLPHTVGGDKY